MENEQLSILVIDKDVHSRNFLSALLLREGYIVQVASFGKEGYISALRDHPDVVVFDVDMGGMPAAEFVRKLRADRRTSTAICVALAETSDEEKTSELMASGCNEYLVKSQNNIQK